MVGGILEPELTPNFDILVLALWSDPSISQFQQKKKKIAIRESVQGKESCHNNIANLLSS